MPASIETDQDTPSTGLPVAKRRRRWWLVVAIALVPLVALTALVADQLRPTPRHHGSAGPVVPPFAIPELDVASGGAIPTAPASVPAPGPPRERWIARLSARTDIPQGALRAYIQAASITSLRQPGCQLQWTLLAGIGRIESDHGQHHGDTIGPDGREARPIIGPALDGSPGVQRIPDTDHGRLDGDPMWDHAVGPMQFLPSRWAQLGQRASGDGRPPDPQNVDDATLTAASYLCQAGDLAVPGTWWAAAFTYNNSVPYGRAVFSAADAYAKASQALR